MMKTVLTQAQQVKRTIIWAVVIIFLAVTGYACFYTISSTERGILSTFGEIKTEAIGSGLHFKIPYIQRIDRVSIQTYKIEEKTGAYTKDIQSADIQYVLNFDIIPENVPTLYTEVGPSFQEKIILPIIYGVVKDVIGTFNASEIVENRDNVRTQVEIRLNEQLSNKYFRNISFQIVNIDYDDAFEQAIVAKQVAEQEALKAKNNTIRIQEEANQKVIAAEAEAKAIKVRADALAKNPNLINYEMVQKWDGKLPQYCLGDNIPLLNLQ